MTDARTCASARATARPSLCEEPQGHLTGRLNARIDSPAWRLNARRASPAGIKQPDALASTLAILEQVAPGAAAADRSAIAGAMVRPVVRQVAALAEAAQIVGRRVGRVVVDAPALSPNQPARGCGASIAGTMLRLHCSHAL